MKKNALSRIIIFSILTLVLITALICGLLFRDSIHFGGTFHGIKNGIQAEQMQFDADQIREIEILWVAGNIAMAPSAGSTVSYQTDGAVSSHPTVYLLSGDKLTIAFCEKGDLGARVPRKSLTISVPDDCCYARVTVDSVSSKISLTNLAADDMTLNTVSGDCTLTNCSMKSVELNTVSGELHYEGSIDTLKCRGVSADCYLNLANAPRKLQFDTVSGNHTLILPDFCGFTARIESLSGKFSSEYATSVNGDKSVYGDGACSIAMDSMSGSLTIQKP